MLVLPLSTLSCVSAAAKILHLQQRYSTGIYSTGTYSTDTYSTGTNSTGKNSTYTYSAGTYNWERQRVRETHHYLIKPVVPY